MSKESQKEKALLRRQELARHLKQAGRAAGKPTGTYEEIPAHLLQKSPFYQRPLNEGRAIEIALAFDWAAFHALNIARRPDGTMWFMDGQQRRLAAQLAYHDKIEVPCMVYEVNSIQREAWVYNRINIDRRGLTAPDKWLSRHTEEDPFVLEVESLLAEFDLRAAPMRGRREPQPGEVVAVYSLEAGLRKAGTQSIRETLLNLSAAFGDNPHGYIETFIRGVWHFIIRFPSYRPQRLRTVLLRHGLGWRPEFHGMDEGIAMALTIHQAYNHREPAERRLAPFPIAPKGRQSGAETNRAALLFRRARARTTRDARDARDDEEGRRDDDEPKEKAS